LFCGQSLAVVVLIVRTLVRVTGSAETSASGAANRGEAVGPLARVLDGVLTCVLFMMAGGCVLIAIGLAAQVAHYLVRT